jgi:hypothetical protein
MPGLLTQLICYRDCTSVNSFMIPYVIEVTGQGAKQSYSKKISKGVVVNPRLDDSLFAGPKIQ